MFIYYIKKIKDEKMVQRSTDCTMLEIAQAK